jgi:glycosyltransferase involved in cell wall biosynthesis
VGRFFHGSHNKKHREMIRIFRRMCERGEVPAGWEYHLVGNLHRGRLVDLEYFAELERLAEGYPVRLLVDVDLDRLVDEYHRASIFWHAAGWGESERRRPEKFEHFGLTTCEAMSSGCIPVVIAKAGQLEIVEHGTTGFLFRNSRELAEHTTKLVRGHGEGWVDELRRRASASVKRFDTNHFEKRLLQLLGDRGLLD